MISDGSHNCFPNSCDAMQHNHNHHDNHNHNQMYTDVALETSSGGAEGGGSETTHLGPFLCNLTSLKEKVHQVQSLVSLYLSYENQEARTTTESTSIALASMSTLTQEIVVTASSMMFNCQQMALCSPHGASNNNNNNHEQNSMVNIPSHHLGHEEQDLNPRGSSKSNNNLGFLDGGTLFNWYVDNTLYIPTTTTTATTTNRDKKQVVATSSTSQTQQGFDIVELDAAALLAKYTHYCQVCGKGFKRDANLRMHMRAHGDEYKSNAALTNPLKNKKKDINGDDDESSITKVVPRKYSCPQEGCRWNKKHARFQPLKSMICVKNHYKRSHCPKMYVCKRCNHKQFSILSDLRTHEKHCGDLKWQCTCGTTFSRKDKLMGHVTLFVGHSPLVSPLTHLTTHNLQSLQNPL